MNQIEKTFITSKLVDDLNRANEVITPEERYAIYQDASALIAVLLKYSKPLSEYKLMHPNVVFRDAPNSLDVFPENWAKLSRTEAMDWRNRLLAEGLGGLCLFRVWYASGGYVEYAGESEESKAVDRLTADYDATWKVFRPASTGFINLVRRMPVDTVLRDPPVVPSIDDRLAEAQRQAESLASLLKNRYPFEVIIVRIPFTEPVGGQNEIRVVKR